CSIEADRRNGPGVIQDGFVSATAFGRRIFIRPPTLGCRAMYVAAPESLRAYMAATSSRTPTRLDKGKIRNGSILYGSTRVISGALTQNQTLAYRWTLGSHTWSRPSKFPKAYFASSTDPSAL